jgi:ABC-2 type transport system permease protein
MSPELLIHEVRHRRTGTAVLGLTLGCYAFFALAISGSLSQTLSNLTKNMPQSLKVFVGSNVPGGYVVGETFTLIAPIALVAYAVIAGASAVAGEERDGTMSMLSAQPVTRTRILLAKAAALGLSLLATTALFWAGLTLADLAYGSELTPGRLAAGTIHLLFLGLAFATIALAIGAATGRTEIASSAAGGIAVAAYLTNAMLPLAGLGRWAELSPWYYALGSDPLRNGIDLAHLGVLTGLGAVALVVAVLTFGRRDLKG